MPTKKKGKKDKEKKGTKNLIYIWMPQLDIDLLEDFLFFAFAALLLGFGDEDSEENAIESSSDAYLAQYYLSKQKTLSVEAEQVSSSSIFKI